MLTRELEKKGLVVRKGRRATTRSKSDGDWGWNILYTKNDYLRDYFGAFNPS